MILNELDQLKKLMESVQLNEYMFRGPSPITELLGMNLFTDAEERPSAWEEEFRENRHWMKIEKKYYDIVAPRLEKAMLASDKIIDNDEVAAAEDLYYDGSDSYGDVDTAIESLPDVYDAQIVFIEQLLGFDD